MSFTWQDMSRARRCLCCGAGMAWSPVPRHSRPWWWWRRASTSTPPTPVTTTAGRRWPAARTSRAPSGTVPACKGCRHVTWPPSTTSAGQAPCPATSQTPTCRPLSSLGTPVWQVSYICRSGAQVNNMDIKTFHTHRTPALYNCPQNVHKNQSVHLKWFTERIFDPFNANFNWKDNSVLMSFHSASLRATSDVITECLVQSDSSSSSLNLHITGLNFPPLVDGGGGDDLSQSNDIVVQVDSESWHLPASLYPLWRIVSRTSINIEFHMKPSPQKRPVWLSIKEQNPGKDHC